MVGEIYHLVAEKGYGFIQPEEADNDTKGGVFFHLRNLRGVSFDELQKGDKVSFDVEETDKGIAARNVQRI